MQEEDVADVKMEGEDEGLSYRRKYKEIKQKVKYLAYVSYFEFKRALLSD